MALPTIGVLDKDSAPQTVNTPNSGRQAAADSQAMVLSTEDKAALDAASSAAATTALQIIDDWDESDRAKVNIIAGQAGVAAGAGAVGATVPRVTLASDDPGVALLTTIDEDTAALVAALTPQVPTVGLTSVFDFTPSCHTGANTAGDVVAATEALAAICRANDTLITIVSIMVIDTADQKAELDLWFFDANTAIGTEDSAPDIDDTEVLTVQGRVNIPAADWYDLGGAAAVQVTLSQPLVLKPASGTDDVYFAVTTAGTPTYAAGSLKFRFGVYKD